MENITRRNFVGTAAVAGLAAAGLAGVGAACAEEAAQAAAVAFPAQATPENIERLGGSYMSLDELNARRHALVDSKNGFIDENGVEVPAVYDKFRALVDTYSYGLGSTGVTADAFNLWMELLTEEEAQAYIEMPYGIYFTAYDFAAETGRDLKECEQILAEFSARGWLFRVVREGTPFYHQIGFAHGFAEFTVLGDRLLEEGMMEKFVQASSCYDSLGFTDGGPAGINAGHAFYYSVPVASEVVATNEILAYDDVREFVKTQECIAVVPCTCRLSALQGAGMEVPAVGSDEMRDFISPLCDHHVETCLYFGEMARFHIENNWGHQISAEECLEIIDRNVYEHGLVLQSEYNHGHEVLCSCNASVCGVLGTFKALEPVVGADVIGEASAVRNYSHYNLNYDVDLCIKCGSCVQRCPMGAISQDEEGVPVTSGMCIRCGQCGITCPGEARKLVARPSDEFLPLRSSLLDDGNLFGAYRFEHGMIK